MADRAAGAHRVKLCVVSSSATVFEGRVSTVVLPAWDGKVGILPGHAPLITLLGAGTLEYRVDGEEPESLFVRRGVVKVDRNRVTVLSEFVAADVPDDYSPGEAVLFPDEISEA